MSTTAWRFGNTEGADDAVFRLKQLDSEDLIDVQDVTVLRWPLYATAPTAQEHVTDKGSKVSSLLARLTGTGRIDTMMIESVKGDMTPGTSAVVVLSAATVVDTVARALHGQPMELVRSDLSVPEQDRLRAAFGTPRAP